MSLTKTSLDERAALTTPFGKFKPVNVPVKDVSQVEVGTRPKNAPGATRG